MLLDEYIGCGLLLLLSTVLSLRYKPYCTQPVKENQTCFILFSNERKTWQQAYNRCQEFKMLGHDGRLAVDDTEETHSILTRLLKDSNVSRAWLAGKTEPFYWNWAPTKTGMASKPVPVFYQGCYNSSRMTGATSTSGDCELKCNHTRFFAVAKQSGQSKSCYCINNISRHTAVDGCGGCSRDLYPRCGNTTHNTAAVYARGLLEKGRFNNWLQIVRPDLTQQYCMQYKRNSVDIFGCKSASCNYNAPKLCVTDNRDNCRGLCNNGSRSHLYYIVELNKPWSRTCQIPGFVPVAITTADIQDDINDLFSLSEPHWVSGTNMIWVWFTANLQPKVDILPRFWLLNNEPDTLNDRCMILQYISGRSVWHWDSCDKLQPFICKFDLAAFGVPSTSVQMTSTTFSSDGNKDPTATVTVYSNVATRPEQTPDPTRPTIITTKDSPPAGQNSAYLAISGGVTLSLAILVSTFTIVFVLRRRKSKPNSPEGCQEPSVYYNDVTNRDEGVVDPAYQSAHEETYTELQSHEYTKLQVNKQEKNKNKQYENTEVKYEDTTAENGNKQYENENNQYEVTNTQYENVA